MASTPGPEFDSRASQDAGDERLPLLAAAGIARLHKDSGSAARRPAEPAPAA